MNPSWLLGALNRWSHAMVSTPAADLSGRSFLKKQFDSFYRAGFIN
jgi:hypothetical protein